MSINITDNIGYPLPFYFIVQPNKIQLIFQFLKKLNEYYENMELRIRFSSMSKKNEKTRLAQLNKNMNLFRKKRGNSQEEKQGEIHKYLYLKLLEHD